VTNKKVFLLILRPGGAHSGKVADGVDAEHAVGRGKEPIPLLPKLLNFLPLPLTININKLERLCLENFQHLLEGLYIYKV
jgi:hypothetical protein